MINIYQYPRVSGRLISYPAHSFPANTICWPNAGLMLAQRRRRWDNFKPALGQQIVFAGLAAAASDLEFLRLQTRCAEPMLC